MLFDHLAVITVTISVISAVLYPMVFKTLIIYFNQFLIVKGSVPFY